MRRLLFLVAVGVVGTGLASGCAALTSYAAKVNGQRITQNELERELNAILDNKGYLEQVEPGFSQLTGEPVRGAGKDTFNSIFVARLLERRIAFELIRQEVSRRKLEVTEKDIDDARRQLAQSVQDEDVLDAFPEDYRDELVRSTAQVNVLERALGNIRVDDAAVRSFYDANRASFLVTCSRHILVEDANKAAQIRARIAAGEDFAAIARAESKDNQGPNGGTAARGGDLGCLPKGSLLPQFEAAADPLQPGQLSNPVQTQFGFHVIQVTERKVRSLEEAAPDIRQRLQGQSPTALRDFVNEAFAKARIEVNPRYGKFVKAEQEVGIKAPKELEEAGTPSSPAR